MKCLLLFFSVRLFFFRPAFLPLSRLVYLAAGAARPPYQMTAAFCSAPVIRHINNLTCVPLWGAAEWDWARPPTIRALRVFRSAILVVPVFLCSSCSCPVDFEGLTRTGVVPHEAVKAPPTGILLRRLL